MMLGTRMSASRIDFNEPTLTAMDEIAILILAVHSLSGMGATFKNNEDLDYLDAKKKGEEIRLINTKISCNLITAIYAKEKQRERLINRMRILSVKPLSMAIDLLSQLSNEERSALGSKGVKGDFIKMKSLAPLRDILKRWEALKLQSQSEELQSIPKDNRQAMRYLCAKLDNYSMAAALIERQSNGRPCTIDSIKSWTCDENSTRARSCPEWAVEALKRELLIN